ncbi:aminopeptidase [Flavobacterium sp.]|uniref:aminopeptidase n=1 Tax=Flavobacterium sp. TaxID=239 RepID=UPI002A81A456|nr:aminopeptidase [Flavobacterium sp.]
MKLNLYTLLLIFLPAFCMAQHTSEFKIRVDIEETKIDVQQNLIYFNSSKDTLYTIVINDWNHSFSSKNTHLADRFSDEFIRSFHLAKDEDRGFTEIKNIIDYNFQTLNWKRNESQIDIIEIELETPILPNSSQKLNLLYSIKLPNDKFSRYGFNNDGKLYFKNCLLFPAIYENGKFIKQSNVNLDDLFNAPTSIKAVVDIPLNYSLASNLNSLDESNTDKFTTYNLFGNHKKDLVLIITSKKEFTIYKNEFVEVSSSINKTRLNDIQKTLIIDKITRFIHEKIGPTNSSKILVSQEDYNKQPFYGLSQLPAFLSPFSDETLFELMFLKTYINAYLDENLNLNHRKENWIYDGIQMFIMMQYIEENNPDLKMMGSLSRFKLLKSYNLINLDFNQQYNYLYMLMARKNLDQPLTEKKDRLIKFNEQISSKYKAGLSFKYLDSYLENDIVLNSLKEFVALNKEVQTNKYDLEYILNQNSPKKIDWFFESLINSRELVDYTFGKVSKTDEKLTVNIINKTKTNVPISLYQLKNDSIVNKVWLDDIKTDSTFVFDRHGADKIVLNYLNEVPEYNLRNNWKSLKGFFYNNRPIKFNFYKDLEEPYYNQLFYVPEFEFNIYDGLAFGMRLNNKSMLNKPFTFSVAPFYSPKTGSLVGKFNGVVEQNIRDEGKLYRIRYILSGSQFHYAENAAYTNLSPTVQLLFRDKNFRENKNEFVQLKQLYINREKTDFLLDNNTENYNVFDFKYGNYQSEITKHYSLTTNVQVANSFGKISTEIHYRKLFDNNRRLSLRFYVGTFLYRSTTSEFFSFGLDRPTDYMFEHSYLGRSESTGIFSQEYVYAEGGFKSKLDSRYANKWLTTFNASFNLWNWVQVYGDVGLLKNNFAPTKFVYDSGIHLNLVPDYFELFLPVYSSNGYELDSNNYGEKVRFIVTLTPKTLVSLFTRRWF